MNALLFSLPGTPVLYYGDEIGMGDNIYLGDRNGVRTPMQWSGDRNAGFSRANPQRLYLPVIVDPEYHYEAINVETQQANASSLLWWTRRLIALRKRFRAFGRGSIEFIYPDNRKVLVFIRRHEDEHVLVVANLSRFVQFARLDLTRFMGSAPTELFGRTEFPVITDQPYFLSLGPHAFYWFQLQPVAPALTAAGDGRAAHRIRVAQGDGLAELLEPDARGQLERFLPRHLQDKRWFQGKARVIRDVRISDTARLPVDGADAHLAVLDVHYIEESSETYALPVLATSPDAAAMLTREAPRAVIAEVDGTGEDLVLVDALRDPAVRAALLGIAAGRRRLRTERGELQGNATPELRRALERLDPMQSRLVTAEQTNTSIMFGAELILKLYRRLEEGESLDLEIGRFLTERGFSHSPAVLGSIEYARHEGVPRTLAVVQRYVLNEGDAWDLTLDVLGSYYEHAAAAGGAPPAVRADTRALLRGAADTPDMRNLIGAYVEDARILGQRTAELHLALASAPDDAAFAPEPFTMFYQRSLYQSMRNLTGRVLQQLGTRMDTLPPDAREIAAHVRSLEGRILERLRMIMDHRVSGMRIRVHGDLHLGQVLFTGNDFIITDFEGEPIRPLSERRLKRSPLRDVAGMLRSFHYAAHASLVRPTDGAVTGPAPGLGIAGIEPWADFWYGAVATLFLHTYVNTAAPGGFLPTDEAELSVLLGAYLLEKAVYELGYELNNRPEWALIPLRGVLELLGEESGG
jgi:maltose alpha-D-glucosyltransferase/alpha-amylase